MHENIKDEQGSTTLVKYPAMTVGTDAAEYDVAGVHEIMFQAVGEFDGATLALMGTLDGENWFTLTDNTGGNVALSSPALVRVSEYVMTVKPVVVGGSDITKIDALLAVWRKR